MSRKSWKIGWIGLSLAFGLSGFPQAAWSGDHRPPTTVRPGRHNDAPPRRRFDPPHRRPAESRPAVLPTVAPASPPRRAERSQPSIRPAGPIQAGHPHPPSYGHPSRRPAQPPVVVVEHSRPPVVVHEPRPPVIQVTEVIPVHHVHYVGCGCPGWEVEIDVHSHHHHYHGDYDPPPPRREVVIEQHHHDDAEDFAAGACLGGLFGAVLALAVAHP